VWVWVWVYIVIRGKENAKHPFALVHPKFLKKDKKILYIYKLQCLAYHI